MFGEDTRKWKLVKGQTLTILEEESVLIFFVIIWGTQRLSQVYEEILNVLQAGAATSKEDFLKAEFPENVATL